jgi:hypothetical protein
MRSGRNWEVARHGLAALAFTLVLADTGAAAATTARVSAADAPIHSASHIVDAWHNILTLRDGAFDMHASAAGYLANLSPLLFSACEVEWCAWSASGLGGTDILARTGVSRFGTAIKWRSSFSIAGSRVWSRVIDFSNNGIRVRLPLN